MSEKDSKKYLAAVLTTALCGDTKLLVGINEHLVSLMKSCDNDPSTADVWREDFAWYFDLIKATSHQIGENILGNPGFIKELNLVSDDT